MSSLVQQPGRADGLGDILERVLDKGVVVAGDVAVSLVGIELLSIRLRLIIASVDKAVEMGINWWEDDPTLSAEARARQSQLNDGRIVSLAEENAALREQLAQLEDQVAAVSKLTTKKRVSS